MLHCFISIFIPITVQQTLKNLRRTFNDIFEFYSLTLQKTILERITINLFFFKFLTCGCAVHVLFVLHYFISCPAIRKIASVKVWQAYPIWCPDISKLRLIEVVLLISNARIEHRLCNLCGHCYSHNYDAVLVFHFLNPQRYWLSFTNIFDYLIIWFFRLICMGSSYKFSWFQSLIKFLLEMLFSS